jgi:DNA-binding MarR family transcriptional regulator
MEKTLTYEFLEVMNNFRKLAGQYHSKVKIHMGEFMMLRVIQKCMEEHRRNHIDEPGIKVGELSNTMKTSKPATSKMLSVIEGKGYIKRVADPKDRRVVYIQITENGEKIIKHAQKMLHHWAEYTIERLGEEDAKELLRLLRKMYDTITEELKGFIPDDKK